MKMVTGSLLVILVAIFTPLGVRAQAEAEPEGVAELLRRLEDVERARRADSREANAIGLALREAGTRPSASSGSSLVLWALGVAAAIFGSALVIRRYRPGPLLDEDGRGLEVSEAIWVGRGQRVMLLRVRGREVLVGASGGQLSGLAVLPPDEPTDSAQVTSPQLVEPRNSSSGTQERDRFATMVKEELSQTSAGAPLRAKQQILRRLNSL